MFAPLLDIQPGTACEQEKSSLAAIENHSNANRTAPTLISKSGNKAA